MVPGAQWIPMDQIEDRLEELPRDQPLIVYCAGGVRSVNVCQFLVQPRLPPSVQPGGWHGVLGWDASYAPRSLTL